MVPSQWATGREVCLVGFGVSTGIGVVGGGLVALNFDNIIIIDIFVID
jgi:hypothetical protein